MQLFQMFPYAFCCQEYLDGCICKIPNIMIFTNTVFFLSHRSHLILSCLRPPVCPNWYLEPATLCPSNNALTSVSTSQFFRPTCVRSRRGGKNDHKHKTSIIQSCGSVTVLMPTHFSFCNGRRERCDQ